MGTLTPKQRVAGAAATLAVCFASTLIVWKWPDSSIYLLGGALVICPLFVFLVYLADRKGNAA